MDTIFTIHLAKNVKIPVHFKAYEAVRKRPEFERDGFYLVKKNHSEEFASPFAPYRYLNIIFVVIALVVLGIAISSLYGPALKLVSEWDVSFDEWIGDYGRVIEVLMSSVMIGFVLIFTFYILSVMILHMRLEGLRSDTQINRNEMRIPKAKRSLKRIRKEDIIHIRVKSMLKKKVLHLKTDQGSLILPIALGDELRRNGYFIDDPNGDLGSIVRDDEDQGDLDPS